MAKGEGGVVPLAVEMVTLDVPSVALAATAKVAVIWEELTRSTLRRRYRGWRWRRGAGDEVGAVEGDGGGYCPGGPKRD